MSDTRPVPTNLDFWPGVSDLVVTYKHILHVLWASPSGVMSIIGTGRAGIIEHLTGACRLDEPVVLEALRELDRRGLVVLDEVTREVAVRRWCRFHKFGGKWGSQAEVAYSKIESISIKSILVQREGLNSIFQKKSKPHASSSNGNGICNNNAEEASQSDGAPPTAPPKPAATPHKKMTLHPSGIECWSVSDATTADRLTASNTAEEIAAAIAVAKSAGKSSVPGTVATFLLAAKKAKAAADAEAAHRARLAAQDAAFISRPCTAAQLAALPAALQTKIKNIKNRQGVTP